MWIIYLLIDFLKHKISPNNQHSCPSNNEFQNNGSYNENMKKNNFK